MCIFKFKKKKQKVTVNKYYVGQFVYFHRYNRIEQDFGYIFDIKQNEQGDIIYDIQVGGQCPTVVPNIKESEIKVR